MTARRGASLVEALVGLALGALAAGVLASSLLAGVRALSLATGVGAEVTATTDAVERLRREGPGETLDATGDSPVVTRERRRVAGRGQPDTLAVESGWSGLTGSHAFTVSSEHAP
jgi:hypothetical protein